MADLIIALVVLVVAVVLGELLYRRHSGTARIWADVTQAVAVTGYLLLAVLLLLGGGFLVYIAGAMVLFFFWVARTKWADVGNYDLRAEINNGGGR